MNILSQILIIGCTFCLHDADSLRVTKYQTEIITAYLNRVKNLNSNEAIESFLKINITNYCRNLRKSYIYSSVTISYSSQPETVQNVPVIIDPKPKYLGKMEQNQAGVQIRKFIIRDSNQTVSYHSFLCLNHNGEPMWFITPTFVPDSAFLFEVAPSIRSLVMKEITGKNEIPVRLIGIIDESFTAYRAPRMDDNILYHYLKASNFTRRDKICDLNRIVQVRLCALVTPSRYVEDGSSSIYYPLEGGCKLVPLKRRIDEGDSDSVLKREMLHCSTHVTGFGQSSFYLGIEGMKSSRIIYLQGAHVNDTGTYSRLGIYKIPLLKYQNIYKKALKDADT